MPRIAGVKQNPHPEGSAEWADREVELELAREERANRPVATERNLTISVGVEAINAAKALGTLSGMHYKAVLGQAAQAGVDALVAQVQAKLLPTEE